MSTTLETSPETASNTAATPGADRTTVVREHVLRLATPEPAAS